MKISKENDTLMTVSEFAKIVGASRSQLIYYDKLGVFSPAVRSPQGTEVTYRYYTLEQIFSYNMLNFYQRAGCSLSEAAQLSERHPYENYPALSLGLERLKQQHEYTLTMIKSLETMLWMEKLVSGSSPEHPAEFELPKPIDCLYRKFDKECRRGTKDFTEKYTQVISEINGNSGILPFPIGLIYSPEPDSLGYFPVRGVVAVYRSGAPDGSADFAMPAGKHLAVCIKNRLKQFKDDGLAIREYLVAHDLIRTMPLIAWNINTSSENGAMYYSECLSFSVISGKTPKGGLPVLPKAY